MRVNKEGHRGGSSRDLTKPGRRKVRRPTDPSRRPGRRHDDHRIRAYRSPDLRALVGEGGCRPVE